MNNKQEFHIAPSFHKLWSEYLKYLAQGVYDQYGDEFILKGGMALRIGYGLPRHSIDLDYDNPSILGRSSSNNQKIISFSDTFCNNSLQFLRNYCRIADNISSYSTIKPANESTVVRIHFQSNSPDFKLFYSALKIDISHRSNQLKYINDKVIIDNICMYSIKSLLQSKLCTILGDDKYPPRLLIRDYYDINFLINNFINEFNEDNLFKLKYALNEFNKDDLIKRFNEQRFLGDNNHIFKTIIPEQLINELYDSVDREYNKLIND